MTMPNPTMATARETKRLRFWSTMHRFSFVIGEDEADAESVAGVAG